MGVVMKKKKSRRIKPRLPMGIVEVLRHKGGAHSSPKGEKGYDRNQQKRQAQKEDS